LPKTSNGIMLPTLLLSQLLRQQCDSECKGQLLIFTRAFLRSVYAIVQAHPVKRPPGGIGEDGHAQGDSYSW
jgi:hypothetical protein